MLEVSTASIFKWPQASTCIQASTEQRSLAVYVTSCQQFGILIFIQNEHFLNEYTIADEICTFFL